MYLRKAERLGYIHNGNGWYPSHSVSVRLIILSILSVLRYFRDCFLGYASMDDGTMLEVRINGEINGDAACLAKLQNTTESISSPSTPGVETNSSLSDTTIALIRKELEHENLVTKPKISDQSHAENFVKCMNRIFFHSLAWD